MPGCLNFEQAMERSELVPLEKIQRMAAEVRPDDVCNMQYTSGTTGFPKGVMLTHRNVVNDGKCIGDRMDLSTADRFMIQVPMFHCFGMVLSMTVVHDPRRHHVPHALLLARRRRCTASTQEKITAFNGVPTMFIAMLRACRLPQDRLQPHAHRHHGRRRLPARAHAAHGTARRDEHDRDRRRSTARPKPAPGCTMTASDRPARRAHRDRRARVCPHVRVQDRRP